MKQIITFLTFILIAFIAINPLYGQVQVGADIDGKNSGDESGRFVAFSSDGNRVVIGAPSDHENELVPGQIRVYDWDGGSWTQVGQDINGEAPGDEAGRSVSLSLDGNRLAFGARSNDGNGDNSGQVRVYDLIMGTWVQVGDDIDGEGAEDFSGSSVSLSSDGNRVAIGAPLNDGNGSNTGQVRIYDWIGGTWTQVGGDIRGESLDDHAGEFVLLSSDGNRVAIGARLYDGIVNEEGHVRIYDWDGVTWAQIGNDIVGEAMGDRSGRSISLSSDGNRVAIGADYNDGNGSDAGHVRIYDWIGGTWTQVGGDIDGELEGDRFGFSLSLSSDGDRVAIGSSHNGGNGADAGHVKIYDWNGVMWSQVGVNIQGEASGDRSGRSVALSSDGSRVAIGAPLNDGNGTDAGHVRIYQISAVSTLNSITTNNIKVYPNPTTGRIEIIGIEKGRIKIIDNFGRIILDREKVVSEIDISGFPNGVYFIQITSGNQSLTKKIIKN